MNKQKGRIQQILGVKRVPFLLKLPPELKPRLDKIAVERRESLSLLIVNSLERVVAEHELRAKA